MQRLTLTEDKALKTAKVKHNKYRNKLKPRGPWHFYQTVAKQPLSDLTAGPFGTACMKRCRLDVHQWGHHSRETSFRFALVGPGAVSFDCEALWLQNTHSVTLLPNNDLLTTDP